MSFDQIALRVENLSKCFFMYDTPRMRLKQFVFPRLQRAALLKPKTYFREFWALRQVSFDVRRGETVGIVGRNGAGKSTLLQLVCGTLTPTGGAIDTSGFVAALLELGSGFNPEFSGRENVYMNGYLLGLSKTDIDNRFDEIAAFADIGDFIEQPVKTYSSGMSVRLAFAVSVCVDPDILIVDEALAVGDEAFQRKCYARIEKLQSRGGTILFVSHSASTVIELCDRAILLDCGELLFDGIPKKAVSYFQRLMYAPKEKQPLIREEIESAYIKSEDREDLAQVLDPPTERSTKIQPLSNEDSLDGYDPSIEPKSTYRYVSRGAMIEDVKMVKLDGTQVNILSSGGTYVYSYRVHFKRPAMGVRFGMLIKTVNGYELGGAASAPGFREGIEFVESGSMYEVKFRFQCLLATGTYFANAGVLGMVDELEEFLDRILDVCMFRVIAPVKRTATGIIDFNATPFVRKVCAELTSVKS
jgi:lipopolysaccharide transport system ATP-binding protein